MTGQPSDDPSNSQYLSQLNFFSTMHRSTSLPSLRILQNDISESNTALSALRTQFYRASNITESTSMSTNKEDNSHFLGNKDIFSWWLKNNNHTMSESPRSSKSSTEIKELEEEEETIEMILDTTLPSDTSNFYNETAKADRNPYEEEILNLKSGQGCRCHECFIKLMNQIPKPPKSTTENKSQLLHNTCNIYKQVVFQDGSKQAMLRNAPSTIITQERDSGQFIAFDTELLNFQGTLHRRDDIAPIWKKDCRMWLWKSVHATCKRRHLQASQEEMITDNKILDRN